ncbi:hypothetical protein SAMN02927937_02547 [Paenimyroides aquimaris]|uniref:Serine aminopeptidase S33 domain-containing protein n=1 Tax=Paenimyroides marinum TaxID=1159016 RepID=A0A1H6MAM3_9FLAO|nr:alpha/beta hydrolase [Paenimyroides aquimaris]SEH98512.1 hypothetical protein SAMN02927937_02547 [Paenimyroides aquimaris]
MKQIILLFILLFGFSSFAQIEGTWNGNIEIPNQKLPFILHITKENGQFKATSDSPSQGGFGLEINEVRFENNTLYLKQNQTMMTYEGKLVDEQNIKGDFKQGSYSFTLNLIKEDPKKSISSFSKNYEVKEIKVSEELIGDLYETPNKETVILLIAGSGPTDRNGNTMGMAVNNSLKYLAEDLAKNNYDVFTYDKRVVYLLKNNKEIPTMDFQHGINDAETVISYLKNTLGYKNIVVAGHSEGSLVGMTASQKNVSAFISLAGTGNTIDVILKEQINKQAPMLNDANAKILEQLKEGKIVKDVNPMLQSLYDEENQPFLIDWIKRNPQNEIAKLNIPVLIINGTKDIQVEEKEAELLHKANPKSTMVIIDNMNHIFKEIEKDEENMASYNNPNLPIQKDLTTVIVHFLNENKL